MTQPMAVYAAVSCLAAIVAGAILTWLVCRVAPYLGLMDYPDGKRKLHSEPKPLGGGLAIFLAVCFVMGANLWLPNPWGLRVQRDWWDLMVLLVAASWIVILGLLDDRFRLRGRHKLAGQIIAGGVLVLGGYSFGSFNLFGMSIQLGWLGPIVAMLWFLATINSINLLDGMDGQAATLGAIFSTTLGTMACATGHYAVAFVAFVLAGATLGFLWFNLPPARIFLGDTGSMLIGLMLGVLAARASLKGPSTFLLAAAIALWTLPFLDSLAAIVRRTLTGRSIYAADRGHIHHCLMQKCKNRETALMVIALCATVTALASLGGIVLGSDMIALITACGVVAFLIVTGLFGRAECRLALSTLRRMGDVVRRRLFGHNGDCQCNGTQFQGEYDWHGLWYRLTAPAADYNILYLRVDLNDPRIQEGYFGEWQGPEVANVEEAPISRHEVPLWVRDRLVGKIRAWILRSGETFQRDLEFVTALVEPFEKLLDQLNDDRTAKSLSGDKQVGNVSARHIDAKMAAHGPAPLGSPHGGNGDGKKSTAKRLLQREELRSLTAESQEVKPAEIRR